MKNNRHNYFCKVVMNGTVIDKCQTHLLKRFRNKIRTINWKEFEKNKGRVYLKVSYGKHLNNFGKTIVFYNDGDYQDKKSFYLALNAFLEK
ncbi:MAG: hypothetical protein ABH819_00635 [Patescibacteria group bacterium]